jgi:hypothetical protein
MQMTSLKIQNGGSPCPKKHYSSTLERISKYHVISIAEKHFHRNIQGRNFRIGPYLSINYQILIVTNEEMEFP